MTLDVATPMLLPGLRVKTSPTQRAVLDKARPAGFRRRQLEADVTV